MAEREFKVGDRIKGREYFKVYSVRKDGADFSPRGIHVQAGDPWGRRLCFSQGGCFVDKDDSLEPADMETK